MSCNRGLGSETCKTRSLPLQLLSHIPNNSFQSTPQRHTAPSHPLPKQRSHVWCAHIARRSSGAPLTSLSIVHSTMAHQMMRQQHQLATGSRAQCSSRGVVQQPLLARRTHERPTQQLVCMSSKLENVPLFADSSSVGAKPSSGAAATSSSGQKATLEDIPLNSEVRRGVCARWQAQCTRWAFGRDAACPSLMHRHPNPHHHHKLIHSLPPRPAPFPHPAAAVPPSPSTPLSWAWTTATCASTCQPVMCARPTTRRAPCS